MANDINSTTVVGRLTRDAELKYTNSGAAITRLSIANGYSKKNGDNWEEQVNYFDVTVFGRRGEALNQYLLKGTQIAVTGELRQDRWEQDGNQRSRVFIKANDIQLLGGSSTNSQANNNQNSNSNPYRNNSQGNNRGNNSYPSNNNQRNQGNNRPSYENYPSGNSGGGNFEDDIPF